MSEIKPALSREAWHEALVDRPSLVSAMRRAWYNPKSPETNDHALAALALYDQPFGFTHEDVTVLRDAARDLMSGIEDASQVKAAERHAAEVNSIADRIAALLPEKK